MRLISSRATVHYKRVLPIFWFAILALAVVGVALSAPAPRAPAVLSVGSLAAILAAIGYLIFRRLVFDLVDEVWDDGAALVVRNGGREDKIALTDIADIHYTVAINPPRVTLSLKRPGSFGTTVAFCAPLRFIPFMTSPAIDALIARVGAANRR